MYLSGVDQYGQSGTVVGRSDVNQLIVVNPKAHRILLVNTPRDYYVQLAGTTGLKDKLTHAGIYGIETSVKTMEELYGIKINYYVRVNFDSLIKVNGKQALAYARERYSYETGDRHRGENQQQVISAIIEKVTGSSTLLANYNSIIKSLQGSIQTDMPSDMIINLFRSELSNDVDWEIKTISVDGTGGMEPTYSMGSQALYVMIPNDVTVQQAKDEISKTMIAQ